MNLNFQNLLDRNKFLESQLEIITKFENKFDEFQEKN